jgi:hypothetical protein
MNNEVERLHTDGTICLEGTQRLPRRFEACCPAFLQRTLACDLDIRYEWWSGQRSWFILISPAAGGGGIAISYCPHCGVRLQGARRTGRWMNI